MTPAKDYFSSQMMAHYKEIAQVSYGEVQIYVKNWLNKIDEKKLRDYLKALVLSKKQALEQGVSKNKLVDFTMDEKYKNK